MSTAISVAMARKGKRSGEVMTGAGVTRSTWYRRMRDGAWTITQLRNIADTLDVPLSTLMTED